MQRTGKIPSGDVTLFYRHFGCPGAVPVLILHGANYFDSQDWATVGQGLARDREVVAIDQRGFGQSSWSPSKNYSNDAHIEDALTLIDHLGWKRVVVMGHSRGGQHATLFAARLHERTAGLVLVDYCPGAGPPPGAPSINNESKVFPSIEAAQAAMSRDKQTPPGSAARARLESILERVEGGYILGRRDPDFAHPAPVGVPNWVPKHNSPDSWRELAAVRVPILIVRGRRSDRFAAEELQRLRRDFAHARIIEVDAGHDIAGAAPEALIGAVSQFLTTAL